MKHLFLHGVLGTALALFVFPANADAQVLSGSGPIDGGQEVPPTPSPGTGTVQGFLNTVTNQFFWHIEYGGLSGVENNAHFHGPAPAGVNAGVQIGLPLGSPKISSSAVAPPQVADIMTGLWYLNIHSTVNPGGEIRGQVMVSGASPGADLCNGDGGVSPGCTDCPCANNAPAGTIGGCLNNLGTSARLNAIGDTSVSMPPMSVADLRFHVTLARPGSFCVLLSGAAVAPQAVGNPCFGLNSGVTSVLFDGLRCAVMGLLRHGGRVLDGAGSAGITNAPWGGEGNPAAGIAGNAGFVPAQTRYFQAVYRDFMVAPCTAGLNTTQAVEVVFTP